MTNIIKTKTKRKGIKGGTKKEEKNIEKETETYYCGRIQ